MTWTLKKLAIATNAGLAAILVALIVTWSLVETAQGELQQRFQERYQSYLLADELRQSSDDLTRLGRTYVVTGDARYESQYMDILDIRNGKKPRPQEYHRVYWDFVASSGTKPRGDDVAVPLQELMKKAGFTDAEFAKLNLAQANSDGLVKLEVIAMNAVKGLYDDGKGNFTVRKDPDFELARKLVHSKEYHDFKAQIMAPIDEFFVLLDRRTAGAVAAAQQRVDNYNTLFMGLLAILFVGLSVNAAILLRGVVKPINLLKAAMQRLAGGDMAAEVFGTGRT
jgi:methyl-accepting chemotaxis protein